jgi:uncharacterized protein (DUF1800 family)
VRLSLEGVLAANRFGLGAKPDEVEEASRDPRAWLKAQIAPADQPRQKNATPFLTSAQLLAELAQFQRERKDARQANNAETIKAIFKEQQQILQDEMQARFDLGFATARPFAERLTWFWSNHFTISIRGGQARLAGAYEREAIRPFIAGKFEDMLLAVASHPAMLIYLNNAQSIGPDSLAGMNSRRGLNENFGRELMELYSLGVNGGYTQADVIALAKLLTGWSVDLGQPQNQGRFVRFMQSRLQPADVSGEEMAGLSSGFRYFPNRHEPGRVSLRGKTYPDGFAGGREAIHDLAHDRATARFIAAKFATHFISDNPPPASVARLETVFRDTGGDLKALAGSVVDDPAAWTPGPGKFRPPVEFVTATYRLLNLPQNQNPEIFQRQTKSAMQACRLMGQFPMSAPSPKGWSDQSQDWWGPDAVLSRIAFARQVGLRLPQNFTVGQVTQLASNVLGARLSAATHSGIAAAANAGEALALLLSSPEFQRR